MGRKVGRELVLGRLGRDGPNLFVDNAANWGLVFRIDGRGEEVGLFDRLGPNGDVPAVVGDEGEDEEDESISQHCGGREGSRSTRAVGDKMGRDTDGKRRRGRRRLGWPCIRDICRLGNRGVSATDAERGDERRTSTVLGETTERVSGGEYTRDQPQDPEDGWIGGDEKKTRTKMEGYALRTTISVIIMDVKAPVRVWSIPILAVFFSE